VGNTQALSGVVAAGGAAAGQEPHEVIYEQARQRIAALDETWQAAVREVIPVAGTPVVAVAAVPAVVPTAVSRPVPPPPRTPVAVPAESTADITAIGGAQTQEAVLLRAAAPRWRRSLAY
jgi:hypothetical protein